MLKKAVLGIVLTLLLTSMLPSAFIIQPVKAEPGTIYIRADGSVDPPTAPIQRDGDVYTFTDNIYDSILVEKNNIVIDGEGYTLQGTGAYESKGIYLSGKENVTVRNTQIKNFYDGIVLDSSSNYNSVSENNITANTRYGIALGYSSYNNISGNNITKSWSGIWLQYSSYNSISGNNIAASTGLGGVGIYLYWSSNYNSISRNNITNTWTGIQLVYISNYNSISRNIIANNWDGIYLYWYCNYNSVSENNITANTRYGIYPNYSSSFGSIYHNNFIDNTQHVYSYASTNIWDDGYPSGGNYWRDYVGIDADGDGIGDTPYIINANNQDRYPLMNPWRWTPPPPPTPTLPVADFTYNPHNPIIDEKITFDASDSYDPDGGAITNYRWEFYRLTGDGAIILPPIAVIEAADKEVVSYSFGKGEYLVTLTVTDDEGETSTTSDTLKVWEKWSFAIIADPQIGIGWFNGEDYGDPGWDDDESGDEYNVTDYLKKSVNLINRHIELGNEYNIAFAVVLGDLSDSAEMSEFNKAIDILKSLKVPWIPVIGNHDVWPYSSWTERYDGTTPDWYFNDLLNEQFKNLANNKLFKNWEKEPVPVEAPDGRQYYFQNFAFDYKEQHFIGLDFNSRDLVFSTPPPVLSPSYAGVEAWAHLYDFEGGTWDWFKKHMDAYQNKGNENTVILSHHPIWDLIPGDSFWWWDMAKIEWYINTNNLRNTIWGNFAGHTHRNADYYFLSTGMYVVETIATFKDPQPRIVQVYYDGTIDYSTWLRDEQKSMWITAHSPVDLAVMDPDGLTVGKELKEIRGAFYLEDDVNEDGLPDDFIVIPQRKIGDYLITVLPEPDAEPTDTYTLEVSGEDATIVLAENVPISDIPTHPYVFNSAALDIPPTTMLDISEPRFVIDDTTYLTSVTSIALTANDNPSGSGVASTVYRIYNATYDSDWLLYTQPFYLTELNDGAYNIDYNSTDDAGNVEPTNNVTVILDNSPPKTTMTVGEPKYVTSTTYVTSDTHFTLEASDNTGSGVYFTAYRIYNSSYDSGWLLYTAQFYLAALTDGVYTIEFNSTDNLGNVEPSNTATVILDNTGPLVAIVNPPVGWALQDGVNFIISAIDVGSGVSSVNFSIGEVNDGERTPVGFEDLPATYNATMGKWTLFFDTLQLPDGYYIFIVKAKDNLGHTGSTIVPYSIKNWAVIELLPASETNKAGRTMPIKFALRVAASVDRNQPFVYNEDLIIRIHDVNDPSNILQTSTFGDTARDYRINAVNELYITNFKTLKTPTTYIVETYRKDMLIDTFDFSTQ